MAAYNDMENSEKVKTCHKSLTRRKLAPHPSSDGSAALTANLQTAHHGEAHAIPRLERHHRALSL